MSSKPGKDALKFSFTGRTLCDQFGNAAVAIRTESESRYLVGMPETVWPDSKVVLPQGLIPTATPERGPVMSGTLMTGGKVYRNARTSPIKQIEMAKGDLLDVTGTVREPDGKISILAKNPGL